MAQKYYFNLPFTFQCRSIRLLALWVLTLQDRQRESETETHLYQAFDFTLFCRFKKIQLWPDFGYKTIIPNFAYFFPGKIFIPLGTSNSIFPTARRLSAGFAWPDWVCLASFFVELTQLPFFSKHLFQ